MRRTDAEAPVRQAPAPHAPEQLPRAGGRERDGRRRAAARDDPRTDRGSRRRVLVVCPALNSPLRHWASDEDDARNKAQERLDASLKSMQGAGIQAAGEIGDGDPIQAIEDALRTFRPDELIVSTHPPGSRTGSSAGSSTRRASASRCRSPTSSSIASDRDRAARPAAAAGRPSRRASRRARCGCALRRVGARAAAAAYRTRRLRVPRRAVRRRARGVRLRLYGRVRPLVDRPRRAALTPAERAQWLDPPHFEIVELHVRPAYQRSGIGSRLLAQLLSRQPHDRALLSTSAAPARRAGSTRRTGGGSLPRSISELGYPPYLVLGKRLVTNTGV